MRANIISGRVESIPVEIGNSIVEGRITSRDFPYLQPYFYNHPFALRCELGMGDTHEEYMDNARKRALEIYDILFPKGADAICFNYWMYDWSDSGDAEINCYEPEDDIAGILENRLKSEGAKLRFLSEFQMKYRHITVRDLPTYDDPGEEEFERNRRNRVLCFSDGIGFDHRQLIEQQLRWEGHEVSFVSFENECIFSVYDDRGCDVVFMTLEKMREFYHKLQPYFLEYDLQEMERRYNG